MQTEMSITVGLARKGLLTYYAYIFRFRLQGVQNGSRLKSQKLTVFMIVLIQRASPVRVVVKDKIEVVRDVDNAQHYRLIVGMR
jgi:hypothetical protein